MSIQLNQVDKVEVLTLQDNYIDLIAQDNNEVVQRAIPCSCAVVVQGDNRSDRHKYY